MKTKHYLIGSLLTVVSAIPVFGQQPYSGCWFPTNIEHWTPENDPSSKFNKSKVPLAKRFKESSLMKANQTQFYGGEIANATILFPMCSLCPSQGADNFIGYQPTYWQYMDKLVYWAGSSAEGIINPPPAFSVDAAHAQGVKVLGNVFFPPKAFGGDPEWVKEFVKKEGTSYPYARKLYEIAKYFGFDGWFINQETAGTGVKSATWAAFVKEFNSYADAAGDTQMEIMWYDGSTVIDAPILSAHKNTSMFLDYHAVGDQRMWAKDINCTEDETFSKIYAGVQCVQSGLTGWNSELNAAYPTGGHVGSTALFCPEERSWRDNVRDILYTSDECGEKAYAAIKKTFENEEKAWVNEMGDPSTGGTSNWRGISGAIFERSAITSLPFVSNMSVGNGKHRFVNGIKQGTQDWNHSGVQSILPTWRWWIENRGNINVAVDWDDAFNHGNCFHLTGTLNGESLIRLYKTNISLSENAVAKIVYKSNGAAPSLKLSTACSVDPDVTIEPGKTESVNGWSVAEYDLSSVKGKNIYMIGVALKGNGSLDFKLGQVAMLPAGYSPAAVVVDNFSVEPRLDEEKGDIRLTWDYNWNNDFDHFDIYLTELSGKRTLVGQTRGEGFYIPSVIRNGKDDSVNVELVPVMKDMTQQKPLVVTAEFPKPGAPKVTLSLSKSFVKVGETVTINAKGSGDPKSWQWTLPSTLQLVDGSLTASSVTVKALAEGIQSVKVTATNELGTSENTFEALDVLSDEAYSDIHNVALKKSILSCSGSANSKENPEWLIDGVTNPSSTSEKWCNIKPESWVVIDCQSVFRLYGFKIFDCKAGPEKNENFKDYTIEVSIDGKEWTKVVDEKGLENENIKETYITPTRGRYIRFSPTVDGTLRVWEFEAYGVDVVKMTIDVNPKELTLNVGETKEVTVNYSLNGDRKEIPFNCVAECGDNLRIGRITENEQASSFTVEVTGGDIMGQDELKLTVNNGGAYKESTIKVFVDDSDRPNVLDGNTAVLRHYTSDYDPDGKYEEFTTGALTDGDLEKEACEAIETPSTHTEDFWAIFEAEDIWNLSKVKVFIPSGNFGENDNGKEGYVNSSIAIKVGDNLSNMTTVKTFDNLGSISELEYIFPQYRSARYLAIVCTLNPYFYPSLAEVQAFEQVDDAVAFNDPAEMSGWLHDIVAEGLPSNSHINYFIEDEDTYAIYTASVHEKGGLPDDGFVRSSTGKKYQLAPYTGNNAISLNKDVLQDAQLDFVEPSRCEMVHILMFSGANSSAHISVKPIYEDSSEGDYTAWTITRYDRTNTGDAGVNFGIIRAGNTSSKNPLDKITDTDHFMFEKNLTVDPSKKLKALAFRSTNYYSTNVIGISKTGYRDATSGIDRVETPASERTVIAIYNLQGVQVKKPVNGLYIIRYSDGTSKKVFIR